MERFDEPSLRRRLLAMPSWKWIAFMALCCERMLPNFSRFSGDARFGDSTVLRTGLDAVWQWLETSRLPADLDLLLAGVDLQAPEVGRFASPFTSAGLDSANATAILLEALATPNVDSAVEVAKLARDTVDLFVQHDRSLVPSMSRFEGEIADDQLMQEELRRQGDDLEVLGGIDEQMADAVPALRKVASRYLKGSLRRS